MASMSMKDIEAWAERDGLLEPEDSENPQDGHKAAKKSQATALVELAGDLALWHTPDMEAFASVSLENRQVNWLLASKEFKRWLNSRYFQEQGKVPGAQAAQDALSVLEGQSLFEGPEHRVSVRLAGHDGKIYLDLTNENWEAVEITKQGWRLVAEPTPQFRRSKGMLAIPAPASGGNMRLLRQFVNVSDGDWPLVLAWLVAALRDTGPYPVLVLNGEHGSAKSTTERVLRRLIDPNKADLRCEPRDPRDLMIAATNGLVVALDNLSHIPTWLSDALCRLATGGGFSTRTLYENDQETIFVAQRPVILNGINEIVTRGDLLDRSLTITCPVIPETNRRTEEEFWREFDAVRPFILGALLDAVSHGLAHINDTVLNFMPRMADFAVWAVATEPALDIMPGTFMAAYTGNRKIANELVLDTAPVVAPLRELLEIATWEGPATELLVELDGRVTERLRGLKSWPKNGRGLSISLRRLAPNLRAVGIEVDFRQSPGSRSKRIIRISKSSGFTDASDAIDSKIEEDLAPQALSVTTHPSDYSDARHVQATQGDASVANIPIRSKIPEQWQEPL